MLDVEVRHFFVQRFIYGWSWENFAWSSFAGHCFA